MSTPTMRLQETPDDSVLEITETKETKRLLSEKHLLRRKQSLEDAVQRFTAEITLIDADLGLITNAKNEKSQG